MKHHQTDASAVQDTTNLPIKLTTAKDKLKVTGITYMNTSKRKRWKAIQIGKIQPQYLNKIK